MQVKQNCLYNIPIIEQYAIMMHKIICHTIRFLKLLYLDRFEVNLIININEIITQSIPLKEELIVCITKISCSPTNMCQSLREVVGLGMSIRLRNIDNQLITRRTVDIVNVR